MSYFFSFYRSPSSLCLVFDSISSTIDEVLSINLSANVFVFEGFNVHPKGWLTYSGGTDRPGKLLQFSLSQTTVLRRLTFLRGSQAVIFWIYFFLQPLVFVPQ